MLFKNKSNLLNIRHRKTSKKNKMIIIAVVSSISCILITNIVFLKFVIPKSNALAIEDYIQGNSIKVAVARQDIGEGSSLQGNVDFISVDKRTVPVDCIEGDFDLSHYVSKIGLKENTVLSKSILIDPDLDEKIDKSSRIVEIDYVKTNSNIQDGDFIDIRFKKFSTNGTNDYKDNIVVSKKKIQKSNGTSIFLKLDESELLNLGLATVDAAYSNDGLKGELYSTNYVDPYNQVKAVITYISNPSLISKIQSDPSIVQNAQEQLKKNLQSENKNYEKFEE